MLDARLEVAVDGLEEVRQWNWVWKPRIVLPSIPSRISRRHGQMPNDSGLGQGMCQNVRIVAAGSRSRIIAGSRAKW